MGGNHLLADVLIEKTGFQHRHQIHPLVGQALHLIERGLQFFQRQIARTDQYTPASIGFGNIGGCHACKS
ncbi:hypothetical protein D3C80_2000630 [compost metagenome]